MCTTPYSVEAGLGRLTSLATPLMVVTQQQTCMFKLFDSYELLSHFLTPSIRANLRLFGYNEGINTSDTNSHVECACVLTYSYVTVSYVVYLR